MPCHHVVSHGTVNNYASIVLFLRSILLLTALAILYLNAPGAPPALLHGCSRSLHEMADRAAEAIRCKLTEGIPFALFGHGMGGILAYEVAIRLKASDATARGVPCCPAAAGVYDNLHGRGP